MNVIQPWIIPLTTCLVLAGTTILGAQDGGSSKKQLTVGDSAPDWTLIGSDGKEYKLSDYKGKQAVVVAWYPVALTGG